MWKWLAIGIGILSVLIAFVLHQGWMPGDPAHDLVGWLLLAILAAQLTALLLRKWRASLIAPAMAFALLYADYLWLGPCHGDRCVVTIQVPAPSR